MSNYLVSYPRSGNTWLRHFFEFYTGLPSTSPYQKIENGKKIDFPVIHSKSMRQECLIKLHFVNKRQFSEEDKILYVLRDYKDVIISHVSESKKISPDTRKLQETFIPEYISNIRDFDSIESPKLLLYYEDLVSDFAKHIKQAIAFYGFDLVEDLIEEYIKNEESNLQTIKKWYHKPIKDRNFIGRYQKYWPDYIANEIDSYITMNFPDIAVKYLYRYTAPKKYHISHIKRIAGFFLKLFGH